MSIGLTAIRAYLQLHFAGHDIPALLAHLETAIGEKVTEAVGGVQLVIDDLKKELGGLGALKTEIEQKVAAAVPADGGAKLEELVKAEFSKLQPGLEDLVNARVALMTSEIQKLIGSLQESVDARVTALFGELLAKASAAEPTAPQA